MLVRKAIKVNQDTWDALQEKAKEVRHSRNNLVNLLFEAAVKMDRDELLRIIYSKEPSPGGSV